MNTKLFVPGNFFSKLFLNELKPAEDVEVNISPASLIARNLSEYENSLGLIPTLDLLTSKELYISSRIGVSFNALLSNAYLYFSEEQDSIKEIALAGDVTSNEIILSKVLFRELYDLNVTPKLLTQDLDESDNLILVGDRNYQDEIFLKGLSFSEEIIELLNAPYINFVLAGYSEDALKSFVNKYENSFIRGHEEDLSGLLTGFTQLSKDFINVNIQHIVFDFENQDLEGIKNILQMPYYYGIIKEMIEIKFV